MRQPRYDPHQPDINYFLHPGHPFISSLIISKKYAMRHDPEQPTPARRKKSRSACTCWVC
ncbi:hypothetical protein FD10_GL000321 [Lactiplantibacillus argentoratensis DSM 16365]|nr:hypothetical protein FD10_GL000321 [Lactiplantibacillus argentoratensis DSM 16365]KTF02900.1 hypothetical protein SF2A35B_0430 [Lactiplantibacillus plantarum]